MRGDVTQLSVLMAYCVHQAGAAGRMCHFDWVHCFVTRQRQHSEWFSVHKSPRPSVSTVRCTLPYRTATMVPLNAAGALCQYNDSLDQLMAFVG